MRTYFFGFFILFCAGLYFLTGCASHKPLAATPVTHPAQKALRPPQFSDSAKAAIRAHNALRMAHVRPKPVIHDTIRDTVFVSTQITAKKHPQRHCKVWE